MWNYPVNGTVIGGNVYRLEVKVISEKKKNFHNLEYENRLIEKEFALLVNTEWFQAAQ